jgi:hypothetical protein
VRKRNLKREKNEKKKILKNEKKKPRRRTCYRDRAENPKQTETRSHEECSPCATKMRKTKQLKKSSCKVTKWIDGKGMVSEGEKI